MVNIYGSMTCAREKACRLKGEQLMENLLREVALEDEDREPCDQSHGTGSTAFSHILGPAKEREGEDEAHNSFLGHSKTTVTIAHFEDWWLTLMARESAFDKSFGNIQSKFMTY